MTTPSNINFLINAIQAKEVFESCREEIEFEGIIDRCGARAEFLLWGKLFPREALGPRCYNCAAKRLGHGALNGSFR